MPSLGVRGKGRAGCFGGSPETVSTGSQAGPALWMVVRCILSTTRICASLAPPDWPLEPRFSRMDDTPRAWERTGYRIRQTAVSWRGKDSRFGPSTGQKTQVDGIQNGYQVQKVGSRMP
jgi:hypothetical protein